MEHQKVGTISGASMKAGMNRKTGAGYIKSGQLPSQRRQDRTWRTKPDAFDGYWKEVEAKLQDAPELEAKTLFEWMKEGHPDVFHDGQLRTLQRRIQRWRVLHGPGKEVYFPQDHKPGTRLSTDYTCMNHLSVTIAGEPFNHLLCHSVLSYSNWEWGVICYSESLLSLRQGLQAVLLQLGHVPLEHWTDHSTAATHRVATTDAGHRGFNQTYLDVMEHFGMTPRTTQVKAPHENGDVESANGAFKRRVLQHLLLRGSRDFPDQETYRQFLEDMFHRANRPRQRRYLEELNSMRLLEEAMLPEYTEIPVHVSKWSMIQVNGKSYSVPSRLIGHTVRVRRYEDHLEVFIAGQRQESMPRLPREKTHAMNYRHVISWLLRKPGAFAEYRFRGDMFPSDVFRRAYDRLISACPVRMADHDYLRILKQAATTLESDMEKVLLELESRNVVPRWNLVMEFWPQPTHEIPDPRPFSVELASYDELLTSSEVSS